MRRGSVLVLLAALLTACGHNPSSAGYSPMDNTIAGTHAQKVMAQEESRPSSPVYRKTLLATPRVEKKPRGKAPGYLVHFTDTLNHPSKFCVWVWSGQFSPLREHYVYDIGRCSRLRNA